MTTGKVAVVGAGVIGLSAAYELLRRQLDVVVLERDRPGRGATHVSAGMLAPISESAHEEPERTELALDSWRRYPAFVRELETATGIDCRYRPAGTLWAAVNRDQAEELAHLESILREKEFTPRPLTAEALRELEPHLSPRVVAGLSVPHDHHVDPRRLAAALEAAVKGLGGEVRSGAEVRAIDEVNGAVVAVSGVEGGSGAERPFRLACDAAVLAAGAWATTGIRSPLSHLGVRPVKGQIVRLRGSAILRHVLRTPEVYFVPRDDGELLVGTTVEEQGFHGEPTAGAVLDILRHAWQVLPGIYELSVVELTAGFRPAVRDHFPVIGPCEVRGLYAALGHFRGGVLLAPATAHYLAEAIVEGEVAAAIRPFLPARFSPAGSSRS